MFRSKKRLPINFLVFIAVLIYMPVITGWKTDRPAKTGFPGNYSKRPWRNCCRDGGLTARKIVSKHGRIVHEAVNNR